MLSLNTLAMVLLAVAHEPSLFVDHGIAFREGCEAVSFDFLFSSGTSPRLGTLHTGPVAGRQSQATKVQIACNLGVHRVRVSHIKLSRSGFLFGSELKTEVVPWVLGINGRQENMPFDWSKDCVSLSGGLHTIEVWLQSVQPPADEGIYSVTIFFASGR